MIERLLETWLDKANERSFQIPFAHSLAYQGHTVLHVSRHCAMEAGKDIISIAPDGVPCAYQLKGIDGRRMTLSKWRADIGQQIAPLVNGKIVHPSLNSTQHHRSYVVVNGDLDEEVQREIDDFNRGNADDGLPERRINTIVKGELFQSFKDLQGDFWATNLHDLKTFLELHLEACQGVLPKEKLARLFADSLPFKTENGRPPGTAAVTRALAGCAVICSAAISPFTSAENHLAEFEAWLLYWCYAAGLAQRWELEYADVDFALDLASGAMFTSLGRMCDELIGRTSFSQGDVMTDSAVYRVRMTHLLGLMGLYGLWMQRLLWKKEKIDWTHLDFVHKFCQEQKDQIFIWGESALPQILAMNFFQRSRQGGMESDRIYGFLAQLLSVRNASDSESALPNGYYDAESVLPSLGGIGDGIEDSFSGSSQFLEGILHLFVRANFKQRAKAIFPPVTRVSFKTFVPDEPWQFFLWRNWNSGKQVERWLVPPHRWPDLREQAEECEGEDLPSLLREYPLHYLAMLIVMPYRVSAGGLRWLATQLDEQAEDRTWLGGRPQSTSDASLENGP